MSGSCGTAIAFLVASPAQAWSAALPTAIRSDRQLMQIQSALTGGPVLKPLRQCGAVARRSMALDRSADLQERTGRTSSSSAAASRRLVIRRRGCAVTRGRITSSSTISRHADARPQPAPMRCGSCARMSTCASCRCRPRRHRRTAGEQVGYALPRGRDGIDVALIDAVRRIWRQACRCHRLVATHAAVRPSATGAVYPTMRRACRRSASCGLRGSVASRARTSELRAETGLVRLTRCCDRPRGIAGGCELVDQPDRRSLSHRLHLQQLDHRSAARQRPRARAAPAFPSARIPGTAPAR